ncbi:DUF3801 domain-containing protein [Enterococcus sp. DIV0187]|uniref:DUF3801 domain-containing protein n=1 Tax=Enterococcus sp. DIV0187 TaxID=2774644 RepID=UPI003F2406BD
MEQKELIHSVYINGTATLRTFFEAMLRVSSGAEQIGEYFQNKYTPSETSLYKLLNQKDSVSVQFLSQKVDLTKIRSYLNQHQVSFAFEESENGVRMYFKAKDEMLIAQALKPVIKDVSTNLGAFSRNILKRPGSMSFKERVEYAQKHQAKYQGTIKKAPTIKAPGKS